MEPYEQNTYPHTDGPSPRNLFHQGPGHDQDVKPDECPECGLQLAAVLRELHVGGRWVGGVELGVQVCTFLPVHLEVDV